MIDETTWVASYAIKNDDTNLYYFAYDIDTLDSDKLIATTLYWKVSDDIIGVAHIIHSYKNVDLSADDMKENVFAFINLDEYIQFLSEFCIIVEYNIQYYDLNSYKKLTEFDEINEDLDTYTIKYDDLSEENITKVSELVQKEWVLTTEPYQLFGIELESDNISF